MADTGDDLDEAQALPEGGLRAYEGQGGAGVAQEEDDLAQGGGYGQGGEVDDGGDGCLGQQQVGGSAVCSSDLTKGGLIVCGKQRKVRGIARDGLKQLGIQNYTKQHSQNFGGRGGVQSG